MNPLVLLKKHLSDIGSEKNSLVEILRAGWNLFLGPHLDPRLLAIQSTSLTRKEILILRPPASCHLRSIAGTTSLIDRIRANNHFESPTGMNQFHHHRYLPSDKGFIYKPNSSFSRALCSARHS